MSLVWVSNRNLLGRIGRTAGLTLIVLILSFTVLSGSIISESLGSGEEKVEERLGADIMAVPQGSGYAEEGILVNGTASAFYMDSSVESEIASVRGVDKVSSQFFMTSVSDSDCCAYLVQIIGYDPDTDFTVTPWVSETYSSEGRDKLIVGANVNVTDGKLLLFGHEFEVGAKLAESGAGMDNTVFVTKDTVKDMIAYAGEQGYRVNADPDTQISVVLVELADGYTADSVRYAIQNTGTDVVTSSEVTSKITLQMGSLVGYVEVFEVTVFVMAFVILCILFSVTVDSRRSEFAVLRMVGATRAQVASVVIYESVAIAAVGALAGIVLSLAVMVPFSALIGDALGLPYVTPSLTALLPAVALSFAVSFVIGPLSATVSAYRLTKNDIQNLFREGER